MIGLGVTRISEEMRAKRPMVARVATAVIGLALTRDRRDQLMRRLAARDRTAEAFRVYNHYMIFRLAPRTA